jgi:uncharacterized spore protein YtfJ
MAFANNFFQSILNKVKRTQTRIQQQKCGPTSGSNVSGSSVSGSGSGSGGGTSSAPYQQVVNTTCSPELLDLEKTLTTERLDEMENKSKAQNNELVKSFSTKSSKSLYQTEQISSLNWYVYYLIWLYAVVAVVFLGFLFAGPKTKKLSIYIKLIITLLLILYPYYITPLEDFLYEIVTFGSNILYGNVYLHPEY